MLKIGVREGYEKGVKVIVEEVDEKGGKVVRRGMGKGGEIGMKIGSRLCCRGMGCVFLDGSEGEDGDLGIVEKNELLVLIWN